MSSFQELSDEQLVHKALETERELVTKRFQHKMNRLENQAQLGGLRRSIARIRTEARRREIAGGLPKGALLAKHRASFQPSAAGASGASSEKGGFLSGIVDKLTSNE
jgi:ribosomal protein L29